MSFRTVVVKNRSKLEYSLNYLVCRTSESEKRICLDEITTLIIQNTGVAITAALLSMLMEKKIKVIFCDSKNNPQGELTPYYGSYNNYAKICIQTSWKQEIKDKLWGCIISKKIFGQKRNLEYLQHADAASKLDGYIKEIVSGDLTNREGHAAKVYFNSCFGNDFSRGSDCDINMFLNYGYSIILSAINREIKALGYLTELGIHHIGEQNPFNLSCDFMEPLRPLVDYLVLSNKVNKENYKSEMINILNSSCTYDGKTMILDNAIHNYVQSLLTVLNENNIERMKFINYELV